MKASEMKKIAEIAIHEENYTSMIENARDYIAMDGRPLTVSETKSFIGIHITTAHTGKMEGMWSLSSSCPLNDNCIAHAKVKGNICEHCFADALMKMRKSMRIPLDQNYRILNSAEIPTELWPLLNVRFFRFESFGDLASTTQVRNYFNLCRRNPETRFALWTKNYRFVKEAIEAGNEKPANLVIIVSSIMMDRHLDIAHYPYADKIFTVYTDEETAAEKGATINCGKRHCLTCGRCYRKFTDVYVNELLR